MHPVEPIPRRWKRVTLSMDTFARCVVLGAKFKFKMDIPEDARLVRWSCDPIRDSLVLVLEHKTFDVIDEGEEIPLLPPGYIEVFNINDKCD